MSLHPSGRTMNNEYDPTDPAIITKTPRSPGPNKLTSFFGWKTSSPIAEVSPATHSDKSLSPGPSPLARSASKNSASSKNMPHAIDVPKANAKMGPSFIADTGFPIPPHDPGTMAQMDDLEEEIREISAELAGSIRREMELEDHIDRLQLEAQQGPELNRRTSDYFSDSGSGSIRYPLSDAGVGKADDLAKQKRSLDQEKAQTTLGLTQKLQDERGRRKQLEAHIQQLSEQIQNADSEMTVASANKVRDLESSLDDHRRRLQEERTNKESVEDLLNALKGEIGQYRDERDNLRDEVVPQLQARLEGLEGKAAELQKLTYENTRMNQELQSLRNENTTLMNARRMQLEMQQNSTRFNAIAEEEGSSPTSGLGLARSPSVARPGGLGRTGSIKRSNSISKGNESRESLAERIKATELQRDALPKALRNLLERQTFQTKTFEKSIRQLESERDKAQEEHSPRRAGYEKEVNSLRYEIGHLRRRADDAINQKYQCEKGLGGLKMDLDRAEQETSSLRILLQEHDILVPESSELRSGEKEIIPTSQATSASLEKAYRELQMTQQMSINRLRELHGAAPSSAEDAETEATMDRLLQSMSNSEAERDFAQKQAAIFRAEAESLRASDSVNSTENVGLADQLRASANRVESLSGQVRRQLESNSNLRQKLAEAVDRGERDQKTSTSRINGLQGRLKELEDKLMTAQQHSEDMFSQHEEEVATIKESHNAQLSRLKANLRTSTRFSSPRISTPMSPMFGARSPRLDKTTSGMAQSLDGALRIQFLERRVAELEGALGEADQEMEEVVSRMNMAQLEVMELQSAR